MPVDLFDQLSRMQYPGRVIVLGKTEENEDIVLYGITGRSESSRARRLKLSTPAKFIFVEVTDEKILQKGDPALLVYNAIVLETYGIVVSNGAQTDLIYTAASLLNHYNAPLPRSTTNILRGAFTNPHFVPKRDGTLIDINSYEPDKPNYTPRISGFIGYHAAALSIIRKADHSLKKEKLIESVPMVPGKGKLLSTYTGENIDPLPSSVKPIDVKIEGKSTFDIINDFFEALGEHRISAAVCIKKKNSIDIQIKNIHN